MTSLEFEPGYAPKTAEKQSLFQQVSAAFRDSFAALGAWRARRAQLRQDRELFRQVAQLDDHRLSDMGVHRYEVDWAMTLPLEVNAARALQQRARRRRAEEAAGYRAR